MKYLRNRPYLLIAALALLAALLEFSTLGLFADVENRTSDWLLRLNAAGQAPDPDIVIVDIDERSLDAMADTAGRWPWPRAIHAELLEGIARQNPAAVVFDIQFTDVDLLQPESDAYLGEVAQATENAFFPFLRLEPAADSAGLPLAEFGEVLGFKPITEPLTDTRIALALPLRPMSLSGRIGAINFIADEDGIGRRYWLNIPADGWRLPSLPVKVADYLGWPVAAADDMVLNWRGRPLSYPRIPYTDLYHDLARQQPLRPVDELKGKIVIIGSTASGLTDLRATPMATIFPAVEILATAIDNLKHGDALHKSSPWLPPLLTLVLIAALSRGFRHNLSPLRLGAGLLAATPIIGLGGFIALQQGLLLPLATPLIFAWLYYAAAALQAYWQERRERQRSIALFSRFLDPRVVNDLIAQGNAPVSLKGQSRPITVLFSDIRNFTTYSESHSAQQVVDLLNDYFSRQVHTIFHHGGTIDKFIGDAIMAFWGAPVDDADQARHAVAAALEMADTLLAFRDEKGGDLANFDVGIGIHSGDAVVGFIGADNRLDYTAIGDTVNLASRIEGQTKGVARILVSAETRRLCGDAFDFIDHGFYKVKGRTQEVQLFEPRRKST